MPKPFPIWMEEDDTSSPLHPDRAFHHLQPPNPPNDVSEQRKIIQLPEFRGSEEAKCSVGIC